MGGVGGGVGGLVEEEEDCSDYTAQSVRDNSNLILWPAIFVMSVVRDALSANQSN